MQYFLAKTDPDTYSIDDLEREKITIWDGVHNHQAIAAIKNMMLGDTVYIYHSQTDKAIVGLAKVVGQPYENKLDERFSWAVKVRFIKRTVPIKLSEIKSDPAVSHFALVRNSRLSTMSVPHDVATWLNSRL